MPTGLGQPALTSSPAHTSVHWQKRRFYDLYRSELADYRPGEFGSFGCRLDQGASSMTTALGCGENTPIFWKRGKLQCSLNGWLESINPNRNGFQKYDADD